MENTGKQFRKSNAILACLRQSEAHPSAEELYHSLQKEHSDISLASVYRNLKLFKEEMGETFINYVTDRRLDRTKKLLLETDLSIKEIAGQTGYSDQNYFSRQFKNKFGISPTDFRNSVTP